MVSSTQIATLISMLAATGYAQFICHTGSNPTFDQCVRNSLVDSQGGFGYTTAEAACASLMSQQQQYYACLCARYQSAVGCYSNFCPADQIISTYRNSATQYCNVAILAPTASMVFPSVSLPPIPTFTYPPSQTTTVSSGGNNNNINNNNNGGSGSAATTNAPVNTVLPKSGAVDAMGGAVEMVVKGMMGAAVGMLGVFGMF